VSASATGIFLLLTAHPAVAEPADGSDLPDAGAPEIEVTPAMIAAGMEEYSGRWLGLRDALTMGSQPKCWLGPIGLWFEFGLNFLGESMEAVAE
jgi:hypothetical protein